MAKKRQDEERTRRAQEIGVRIAQACDASGWTNATRFAAAIGVDRNSVGRWSRGEAVPDALTLDDIARVTGVSADWLLRGQSSPEWAAVIAEWRSTPTGSRASSDALAFLDGLHLEGYAPTTRFLDLALIAYEHGLSPAQTVQVARETDSHRRG